MSAADEEFLVGRCYTKARRHPSMIGQWEGRRLWGGPYSVPQFVTMGVVFAGLVLVLVAVPGLWAQFGIANLAALVLLPYLSSLLVRRLHIDGRHPFSSLISTAGLVAGGQRGRIGGRALPRITAQPLLGSATVTRSSAQSASARPRPLLPEATPSAAYVTPGHARHPRTTQQTTAASALTQLAARRSTPSREHA